MKIFLGIVVFLAYGLSSYGQSEGKITYYSSVYMDQISDNVIGDYYLQELFTSDSITVKELFQKSSGKKLWSKSFKHQEPFGVWCYYENATVIDSIRYGEHIPKEALVVDFLSGLPVGVKLGTLNGYSLSKYIVNNGKFLKDAIINAKPNGVVEFQLTLEPNGEITNVSILTSIDESVDKVVYNLILAMPNWTPATKDGKPIQVYMTMAFPIMGR